MIGRNYWSTGITVGYGYAAMGRTGWHATLSYLDDGFCSDVPGEGIVSTQGTLSTRYVVPEDPDGDVLSIVVNVIKADAERLGITWNEPCIYYKGDGEDPDWPPPDGWREMVDAQARRLGWRSIYTHLVSEEG